MHIFAKDETLIAIGSAYLRIAGWSYLLTGVSQCYLTTMKVSEHIKPGALISCCAVILNICLNAVFIFGLFGARECRREAQRLQPRSHVSLSWRSARQCRRRMLISARRSDAL